MMVSLLFLLEKVNLNEEVNKIRIGKRTHNLDEVAFTTGRSQRSPSWKTIMAVLVRQKSQLRNLLMKLLTKVRLTSNQFSRRSRTMVLLTNACGHKKPKVNTLKRITNLRADAV